jgi:DNA-binding Lrp family transcriptional regulator
MSEQIINKDELLMGNWTPVRNEVWQSPALSPGAKLCYIAICSHIWRGGDNNAWPGQKRLAEMLNVSERWVRNYLRELEAVGLIETKRQGLNKTNVYYLLKPDADKLNPSDGADRKYTSAPERKYSSAQDRKYTSAKEEEVEEKKVEEEESIQDSDSRNPEHPADSSSPISPENKERLEYVRTVAGWYNGQVPLNDNLTQAVQMPRAPSTLEKHRYDAVLCWHNAGLTAHEVVDRLERLIEERKDKQIGGLNYFKEALLSMNGNQKQGGSTNGKKTFRGTVIDYDNIDTDLYITA